MTDGPTESEALADPCRIVSDNDPCARSDSKFGGVVSAIVRHHDQSIDARQLRLDVPDRRQDAGTLVVRGNDDRDASSRRAASRAGLSSACVETAGVTKKEI